MCYHEIVHTACAVCVSCIHSVLSDGFGPAAADYWSEKPTKYAGIAIELNGEDNYLTDVIIFDGGQDQAVLINGAATVLKGVHTWGGPLVINGTYDIQDRILGCYIDYNTLDIFNPNSVTVSDTFFVRLSKGLELV